MKWYQYLIPTYGNWGGPGWSGGKFTDDPTEVDWDVAPIDYMDYFFKKHDSRYQQAGFSRRLADLNLLYSLRTCPVKGWWANAYLVACILIFTVKARL
jgi:hypothetical protein